MKRILVPVDFSPAMNGVLKLASEMARGSEMELHLVHVREIAAVPVFPATAIGYPGIGMPAVVWDSLRVRAASRRAQSWNVGQTGKAEARQ